MTLKKGIIVSQKKMRQQKVRHAGKYNPILARLKKNKDFTRAVNRPAEWREIHSMIKKISEGGVYKNELRELSDTLAHGNEAKTLSHKEGRLIAEAIHEEFCPELKKYKSSRNSTSQSANYRTFKSRFKAQNISEPKESRTITPMNMARIMNKVRTNFENSSENKDGEQSRSSFSKALEATTKNKK